jgi:hypothetical protein
MLGVDIAWLRVLLPLLVSASVRVLGSLYLAWFQFKQDNAMDTQLYIPQICHVVNGIAYIAFYILVLHRLEGDGLSSFRHGILVPAWISIALSILIPALYFRPIVPENEMNDEQRVAHEAGQEVRRTGNEVFNKALNEQIFNFIGCIMIGAKLDGAAQYSWVSAFAAVSVCVSGKCKW